MIRVENVKNKKIIQINNKNINKILIKFKNNNKFLYKINCNNKIFKIYKIIIMILWI